MISSEDSTEVVRRAYENGMFRITLIDRLMQELCIEESIIRSSFMQSRDA